MGQWTTDSIEVIFFVFLLSCASLLYYLLTRKRHRGGVGQWRLQTRTATGAHRGRDQVADSIRVLVAEDNAVSARILDVFLGRMGCSATLTRDGKEALRAACAQKFSLAIVDLSMPEMDGFDFASQYRRQEGDADHLPIVALTADTAEKVSDKCLSAGIDGIISKPIMYDQLVSVIQQYTGRRPGPHISPGGRIKWEQPDL